MLGQQVLVQTGRALNSLMSAWRHPSWLSVLPLFLGQLNSGAGKRTTPWSPWGRVGRCGCLTGALPAPAPQAALQSNAAAEKKGTEGQEPTAKEPEEPWALPPSPWVHIQQGPSDTNVSISLSFDIRKIYIATFLL